MHVTKDQLEDLALRLFVGVETLCRAKGCPMPHEADLTTRFRRILREDLASPWTSVDDDLPHEPGRYLVCSAAEKCPANESRAKNLPFIASWHRGRGWHQFEPSTYDVPGIYHQLVTHWMKLPDAAKAVSE